MKRIVNQMKKNHGFIVHLIALISISLLLSSCKKKIEVESPVLSKPKIEYLKLDVNSANQLTVSEAEKDSYVVTTTGEDPYILTKGISKSLHQDSVVLTF